MAAAPATAEVMAAIVVTLAEQPVETCAALYLDGHNRLAGTRHIIGGKERVDISIRAIAIDALAFDARAVVIAHNHPSGDQRASADDLIFTRTLAQGLRAIGVTLADHLILARGGATTSLRAKGYL